MSKLPPEPERAQIRKSRAKKEKDVPKPASRMSESCRLPASDHDCTKGTKEPRAKSRSRVTAAESRKTTSTGTEKENVEKGDEAKARDKTAKTRQKEALHQQAARPDSNSADESAKRAEDLRKELEDFMTHTRAIVDFPEDFDDMVDEQTHISRPEGGQDITEAKSDQTPKPVDVSSRSENATAAKESKKAAKKDRSTSKSSSKRANAAADMQEPVSASAASSAAAAAAAAAAAPGGVESQSNATFELTETVLDEQADAAAEDSAPEEAPQTFQEAREAMATIMARVESRQQNHEELSSYVRDVRERKDESGGAAVQFPQNFDEIVSLMGTHELDVESSQAPWSDCLLSQALSSEAPYGTLKEDGPDPQEQLELDLANIMHLDRKLQLKARQASALASEIESNLPSGDKQPSRPSSSASTHSISSSLSGSRTLLTESQKSSKKSVKGKDSKSSSKHSLSSTMEREKAGAVAQNKERAALGAKARYYTLTEEEEDRVNRILDDGGASDDDESVHTPATPIRQNFFSPFAEYDTQVNSIDCELQRMMLYRGVAVEDCSSMLARDPIKPPVDTGKKNVNYLAEERQQRELDESMQAIDKKLDALSGPGGEGDGAAAKPIGKSELDQVMQEALREVGTSKHNIAPHDRIQLLLQNLYTGGGAAKPSPGVTAADQDPQAAAVADPPVKAERIRGPKYHVVAARQSQNMDRDAGGSGE
jgi:hypothetical protein